MFLMPGIVIAWYVTNTPISTAYSTEIANYLFARQNTNDGGWGLHIEGESSVFGTCMNYVVMRIVGVDADEPRMIRARACLHRLGGATAGPHWTKFWLSVLGVTHWDIVNPVPPELWLLPDWMPIAPWRWWIHMRMVFLPMSYIWSRKFVFPENKLVRELRQEVFVESYEQINFARHRNTIASTDNYHPKTWVLNLINFLLVWLWIPLMRTAGISKRAEDWTFKLIQAEDENSDFSDLAPVNNPMNMLACYIADGPDSYSVRRHRERLEEFLWVKDEGMLANGTNGVQTWDTAWLIQAVIDGGLAREPEWRSILERALEFLDDQQIREDCNGIDKHYRQQRKGAWAFSTRLQGYTVSDCTSEAMKAVIMMQALPWASQPISDRRLFDSIDVLLTMQNPSGGFASYEPARGSELLEYLNAAEVFGRIMVEYDYPECTTAVVTALSLFTKVYPEYRAREISETKYKALTYIRNAQRADGSWYGSWGICFTYAGMFALESLASAGETYTSSARVRKAVQFFLDRQLPDGGWGETYKGCETGVYCSHERGQVVQTAWVLIGMLEAGYSDREPMDRAVKMIMSRQLDNGEWPQEAIEGVFNKSW